MQIDGSLHNWFEDRAPKRSLLVYVDDATSKLMELRFVSSESMHTYFLATKSYINGLCCIKVKIEPRVNDVYNF